MNILGKNNGGSELEQASPLARCAQQVVDMFKNVEGQYRLGEVRCISSTSADEARSALQYLKSQPAAPVFIVHAFSSYIDQNPDILPVIRYPNVRTLPVATAITSIPTAFAQPHSAENTGDLQAKIMERELGTIRHDLGHAVNGKQQAKIDGLLTRARERLLLTGTDQELTDVILQHSTPAPSEYWEMDAAMVDWDGTLAKDNVLDVAFLERVRQHVGHLPLSVWTGGDVENVYGILRSNNIKDLHVCSKDDCRGIEVLTAIDDEEPAALKNKYGFNACNFISPNMIIR